jgi:hypothetical protein
VDQIGFPPITFPYTPTVFCLEPCSLTTLSACQDNQLFWLEINTKNENFPSTATTTTATIMKDDPEQDDTINFAAFGTLGPSGSLENVRGDSRIRAAPAWDSKVEISLRSEEQVLLSSSGHFLNISTGLEDAEYQDALPTRIRKGTTRQAIFWDQDTSLRVVQSIGGLLQFQSWSSSSSSSVTSSSSSSAAAAAKAMPAQVYQLDSAIDIPGYVARLFVVPSAADVSLTRLLAVVSHGSNTTLSFYILDGDLNIIPPSDGSLTAPSDVNASFIGAWENSRFVIAVQVSWKDVSGESGYVVERRADNDNQFVQVGTIKQQSHTSLLDRSLPSLKSNANATFYYRVAAINVARKSNYSAEVGVMVQTREQQQKPAAEEEREGNWLQSTIVDDTIHFIYGASIESFNSTSQTWLPTIGITSTLQRPTAFFKGRDSFFVAYCTKKDAFEYGYNYYFRQAQAFSTDIIRYSAADGEGTGGSQDDEQC